MAGPRERIIGQNTCPKCGTLNQPDYAFCAKCGNLLRGSAPSPPATFAPPAIAYPASSGYGFAGPTVTRVHGLAKAGAGLVAFGGILVGVGWLLPDTTDWWIAIGVGYFLLGIGLGLGILGVAQSR